MMMRNRQSNGELLRLICMLMIVMHHFIIFSMYPGTFELEVNEGAWDQKLVLAIHCFIYIGVNCFVLLSGWYSIRLKPKSVINLWSICFFYAVIRFFGNLVDSNMFEKGYDILSWKYLSPVLLPFSHTGHWFITCYVALMLLSPILNKAIDSFNRPQLRMAVVLTSIMCLWFGFLWGIEQVNDNGYNTMQFIWLYLIGGYLRRCCDAGWLRMHRRRCLWVYVGCSLLWGLIIMLKEYGIRVPFWRPFTYCNPLVMGASIGFFLFVMSFEFKNRTINWLASSVLAVYLVQDGVFQYNWLANVSGQWTPLVKLLMLPLLSVCFMLAVLMFDKIRVLMMKPFWAFYDRRIEPWLKAKFLTR